jgi:transposase InsO family protein
VNIHKNARVTFARRVELVHDALRPGANQSAVARTYGVSRQTVRKWCARFREAGLAALHDRSSRPHHCRRQLPRYRQRQIARRRHHRWSSPRIAQHYGLALSTVVTIQRRLGLHRLDRLEPPRPIVRYEHARPGALLHLDTKQFGRIRRPGHRVTGSRRGRAHGTAGWEHLHVAIDDCTRLTYAEMLPSNSALASVAFLEHALAWFAAQGVRVRALLTDNGGAYCSARFAAVVATHRLTHRRTRPFRPQTNGKAERVIRTLAHEWAYAQRYRTSAYRTAALARYLHHYNTQRRHTALHFNTPAQRLAERL